MQTRSSKTGKELQYNPEIEKLAKKIKKEAKERKRLELASSSSDSDSEIDLFIVGISFFDNPFFQEFPMAAPARTLKELATPAVNFDASLCLLSIRTYKKDNLFSCFRFLICAHQANFALWKVKERLKRTFRNDSIEDMKI